MDRMIECPACNGHGGDCDADNMGGTISWQCDVCYGSGRIPDRRAHTDVESDRDQQRELAEAAELRARAEAAEKELGELNDLIARLLGEPAMKAFIALCAAAPDQKGDTP